MMSSLLQHTKSNGKKKQKTDNSKPVKDRWCAACSRCWLVVFILSTVEQREESWWKQNLTGPEMRSQTYLEKRNASLIQLDSGNTQEGCEVQYERGGTWKCMMMFLCHQLSTLAVLPVPGSPHGVALVTVAGVVPHWAQQTRRQAAFRRCRLSLRRRANGARVLALGHLL